MNINFIENNNPSKFYCLDFDENEYITGDIYNYGSSTLVINMLKC